MVPLINIEKLGGRTSSWKHRTDSKEKSKLEISLGNKWHRSEYQTCGGRGHCCQTEKEEDGTLGERLSAQDGAREMGEGLQVGGTRKCRIRKVRGTLYLKKR